jgi:hypothetical protein
MPTATAEPKVNEEVVYHSPYRTGAYHAVVSRVNADGTVALKVYLPGAKGRWKIDEEPAITLRSVSYGPQGLARPKGT